MFRRRACAALLVVAMGGACSRTANQSPPPEGFVDVLDSIGRSCADTANTYECAKAVEQYRLGKGVPGVTRVGKRLSIAVKTGAVVDLTDSPDPGADDYTAYGYTEYIGCFGYHLVHRELFEGQNYLMIHAETGAKIDLPGVPILAPDCGRLAVVAGLPYAASLLQIWRLNESARATLEWGHQPDTDWTPGIIVWKTPVLLEVPYVTDDGAQTKRTLVVRLYTDGWRVEP